MPKTPEQIEKEKQIKQNLAKRIENNEKEKQRPLKFLKSEAEPEKGFLGEQQLKDTKITSKNVSEEFIESIVLGAALDEDTLKDIPRQSNGVEARDYMVMNVLTTRNERDTAYEIALLDARKKAQEAIRKLDEGDDSLARRYAGNFTNYLDNSGNSHSVNSLSAESNTFKTIYKLYDSVCNENVFKNIKVSEATAAKMQEKIYVGNLVDKITDKQEKLYGEIDKLSKEDKEELILDILTIGAVGKLSMENDSKSLIDQINTIAFDYALGDRYDQKVVPMLTADQNKKISAYGEVKNALLGVMSRNMSNIASQVLKSNVTYQTKTINDPDKRNDYIDKVRTMIAESKQYKELIATDDIVKIDDCITKYCLGNDEFTFAEKDGKTKEGIDIEQLYLDNNEREADEKRRKDLNDNFEKTVTDKMNFSNFIDDAISEQFNVYLTSLQKQYPTIKKAFDEFASKNGLDPQMDFIIHKDGQYERGEEKDIVPKNILKGEEFYLKSNSDNKFFKINAAKDNEGKYTFTSETIDHIKMRDRGFYSNLRFYEVNNSLAKETAGEIRNSDCEMYAYAASYVKTIQNAYSEIGMPDQYKELTDSLLNINKLLKAQYEKNKTEDNGNIKPKELNSLINAYDDCKIKLKNCRDYNPYDSMTQELGIMVDRDLEFLENSNLERGDKSLAAAIREKKTKDLDAAKNDVSNKQNLDAVVAEVKRLKHNLIVGEKANKKPNPAADAAYRKVIEEVDVYLKASTFEKRNQKNNILRACNQFIKTEGTGKDERFSTVYEVGKFVQGITKIPLAFAFEKEAKQLLEKRRSLLAEEPDSLIKRYFLNPENEKKLLNGIANTKMCQEYAKAQTTAYGFLKDYDNPFGDIDAIIIQHYKEKAEGIEKDIKDKATKDGLNDLKFTKIYDSEGNKLEKFGEKLLLGEVYIKDKSGFVKAKYDEKNKDFSFERKQTIPDASFGADEKLAKANLEAAASEYKNAEKGCNISNKLDSWLKFAENLGGNAEKSDDFKKLLSDAKNLNDKVNAYFTPNKEKALGIEIDRYPEINAQQFADIKASCKSMLDSLENYPAKNKFTDELKTIVGADAELFGHLSFEKGPMPLAEAVMHYKNKSFEKQENRLEYTKNIKSIKGKIQTEFFHDVNDEVVLDYIAKNNLVQKYPDGVVRKDEVSSKELVQNNNQIVYYKQDGSQMTEDEFSGLLISNAENIKKEMEKNYSAPYHDLEDNCSVDPAVRDNILKDLITDYIKPSDAEIQDNNEVSLKVDKKLNEVMGNRTLELHIACHSCMAEREIQSVIRTDGSAESRAWNKEMIRNVRSKNHAERKKGYEMILDDLQNIDPNKYDLRDASIVQDKTSEVINYAIKAAEVQKLLVGAKNAGVDIYDPKYDNIRNNISILEATGAAWNAKIRMMANPLYSYIGPEQLNKITSENVSRVGEELNKFDMDEGDKYGLGALDEDFRDKMQKGVVNIFISADCSFFADQIKESGNSLLAEGNSNEKNIEEARRNFKLSAEIDPNDEKLCALRKELVGNKRHGLFGEKKNSEKYNDVIKAIDAYRDAKPIDKEKCRIDILKKCFVYGTSRGNKTARGKLIEKIFNEVEQMKPGAIKLRLHGLRQLAKELVGDYTKKLQAAGVMDAQSKRMYDIITKPQNYEHILDKMAQSDVCWEYRTNPGVIQQTEKIENRIILATKKTLGIDLRQQPEQDKAQRDKLIQMAVPNIPGQAGLPGLQ